MSARVKIAISGSYGGTNLGDEAILAAIVDQIRRSQDAEITVFTRCEQDTLQRHPVDHAVNIRSLARKAAQQEVCRHDYLILGGGGILYDHDVEAYLREVALANEQNIPVMVYGVSAGPLIKPSSRRMIAKHLSNAAVITVRDHQGLRLLEECGVEQEITLTADPALLLTPAPLSDDILAREGIDPDKKLVGMSVREPGPAAPDISEDHYHSLLANAADFIIERYNAKVVFVPMERRSLDLQHAHAVAARMQFVDQATILKGEYTSDEMLALVSHFHFCVGMRLHFLIFSALQGVPFVPLPYASKVIGFIEELGISMPPLTEVNVGQLIAYLDHAWDNREKLRCKISTRLPFLQERARENNRLLFELIKQRETARQLSGSSPYSSRLVGYGEDSPHDASFIPS